jgi:hypothetical protein
MGLFNALDAAAPEQYVVEREMAVRRSYRLMRTHIDRLLTGTPFDIDIPWSIQPPPWVASTKNRPRGSRTLDLCEC